MVASLLTRADQRGESDAGWQTKASTVLQAILLRRILLLEPLLRVPERSTASTSDLASYHVDM